MPVPLPIDDYIPGIVARVRDARAAVVVAHPGAGKTTRVPPALVADGPVILLQPRRVAARSIARRIAEEQGWTVGREVGWHVRYERQFSDSTRLLVATEGILTARLQQDPLLSAFSTIVLDEFHERSIHADLGIALSKQAWTARTDLRLVIMSATIDAARVSAFLGGCPIVEVPGLVHPLDIQYRPDVDVGSAVREALAATPGQVLCFLPGAPEIRRALPGVQSAAGQEVEVVQLHGSMEGAEQDAALADVPRRRVILATNIAETSLSVPGVSAVVDTGLHKVARYDPDRAIDSLDVERITRDSADQRAGRAGRLGPGTVWRLWAESDKLRPHREPDIRRVDLSGPLLDVLAWGADPGSLEWFEPPDQDALAAALDLLGRLGAVEGATLTPIGRRMHTLPVHPRLARILLDADGSWRSAVACALLSERHFVAAASDTTSSDMLSAIDRQHDLPSHVIRAARELQKAARAHAPGESATEPGSDDGLRRALLAGYPDRVARRRAFGSARVLLASGHGAVIGPESGVRESDYLIALDVQAGRRGDGSEARIRLASAVDREWLTPTHTKVEHELDSASGRVRAFERDYYGALVLAERSVPAEPEAAAVLLCEAFLKRALSDEDEQLVRRLRFAGIVVDLPALVTSACVGHVSLSNVDLERVLAWDVREAMDRHAPRQLKVPSGRSHDLVYHADGTVSAPVKLQELFGLADTPRLGPHGEPVLLVLLAPNGRPVQSTRDLRSFWERTYPEVRKELRGRYPRHPWPEDPWTAVPTARTTRGPRKG